MDQIEISTQEIVGGSPATVGQFPTVVALEAQGQSLCTGTLVHPSIVLTAAHCISPLTLGVDQNTITQAIKVRIGSVKQGSGGQLISSMATIPNPAFNDNALGDNDIGIIRLAQPVTGVTPTFINRNPSYAPPGIKVTQVGFGITSGGAQDSGTERYILNKQTTSCSSIPGAGNLSDTNLLCYSQTDSMGKCSGDSGGPSFATINGKEYVVGVTSFGDQNCAFFGADTRPDGETAWLDQVAPELKCQPDGTCLAECGANNLPEDPDCPTCQKDSDCGDPNKVCDEGHCEPKPGTPGGVGGTCTDNTQCASGICADGPDGKRCVEICDPNNNMCPENFDCLSTGGGGGACWPGADFDPNGDGDEGPCGCRVGGASRGAGLFGAIALLGLVGLITRRRR